MSFFDICQHGRYVLKYTSDRKVYKESGKEYKQIQRNKLGVFISKRHEISNYFFSKTAEGKNWH